MQEADFVDNQRGSRLCSLDSTTSSTVFLTNCRRIAPSLESGQNKLGGYLGMKQGPQNAVLSPLSIDKTYIFANQTKRSC